MIAKDDFFRKYGISDSKFKETRLIWKDLIEIYEDYLKKKQFLEPAAVFAVGLLKLSPQCHAITSRIKHEEHVIEKIIRQSTTDKKPFASIHSYERKLGDLIGVRLIHKFKDEWELIHDWILRNLKVVGKPEAHISAFDSPQFINDFINKGFKIKSKDVGYRSLHYRTKLLICHKSYYAEVQMRTLYEEAWGEIDHKIRYPYMQEDFRLNETFKKASCAAGLADGLGSLAKLQLEEINLRNIGTDESEEKRADILLKISQATNHLKPFVDEINKLLE